MISSAWSNETTPSAIRMDARRAIVLILIGAELRVAPATDTLSGAAGDRKQSLNLFRVAAINRSRFTFIIARADDDLQLPVAIQIQYRDNFVSIGSIISGRLRIEFALD